MGKENTDYHFCCSECGARFDLSTKYGIKAAQYGLCSKCFCEIQLQAYKNANILQKILYFIPHIIILRGYKHYYGKKEK